MRASGSHSDFQPAFSCGRLDGLTTSIKQPARSVATRQRLWRLFVRTGEGASCQLLIELVGRICLRLRHSVLDRLPRMPGTESRYNVSWIAFVSSSDTSTAFARLPVITRSAHVTPPPRQSGDRGWLGLHPAVRTVCHTRISRLRTQRQATGKHRQSTQSHQPPSKQQPFAR